MKTGLIAHPACLNHEPPMGHPESPDRLRAITHALEAERFQFLRRMEAPRATREAVERVHAPALIAQLIAAEPGDGERGCAQIDGDTYLSHGSIEAAFRAAGAVIEAVDKVLSGELENAFCAVRPPGHHAEPDRAMGFCLFNNVAIAAAHARAVHGLSRVAIVDFDVHHGNGTEAFCAPREGYFYGSTHQWPNYPGTGRPEETGGFGNIANAVLSPGAGSEAFRAAMETRILPALERFAPELVIVSAGFDAHRADPLASLRLETADFAWATRRLMAVADAHAGGRIVSALEGGYDLEALAASAVAHVAALMGDEG